jgi:dienelactone hydrolase
MNGNDKVVVWYPVDRSAVAGRSTYSYSILSWVPPGIAAIVPSTVNPYFDTEAYQGAPPAGGRFPVVLFSHGYGGYPEQSSFLTAHLATWGFVVAAPDQTQSDLTAVASGKASSSAAGAVQDLRSTAKFLQSQNAAAGSLLAGRMELRRIGVVGHSLGGEAAVTLAATDPAVSVYVAMAGVPTRYRPAGKPGLLMTGTADQVVPSSGVIRYYQGLSPPKRLIVIDTAGHNAYDDECEIGGGGGAAAIAEQLHLPIPPSLLKLGLDGCSPPDVSPTEVWPLIRQATVAELRAGLGIDRHPVGFDQALTTSFPGVSLQLHQEQ